MVELERLENQLLDYNALSLTCRFNEIRLQPEVCRLLPARGNILLNPFREVFGFPDVVCMNAVVRCPDHPAVYSGAGIPFLHLPRHRAWIDVVVSLREFHIFPTMIDLKYFHGRNSSPLRKFYHTPHTARRFRALHVKLFGSGDGQIHKS